MDFVWQYIEGEYGNEELRRSVKSVQIFCKDAGNLFVVGDAPGNIPGVIHIPSTRVDGNNRAWLQRRAADVVKKYHVIIGHSEISYDFVLMHDDMYFIRPFFAEEIPVTESKRLLDRLEGEPSHPWLNQIKATQKYLKTRGYPDFNFETHTPVVMNKKMLKLVLEQHDIVAHSLMRATVYFNHHHIRPDAEDKDVQLRITTQKIIPEQIAKQAAGKLLINTVPNAFGGYVLQYLNDLLGIKKIKNTMKKKVEWLQHGPQYGFSHRIGHLSEMSEKKAKELEAKGAIKILTEEQASALPSEIPARQVLLEAGLTYEEVEQMDAESLQDIKGIGKATANAIVEFLTTAK